VLAVRDGYMIRLGLLVDEAIGVALY